MGLVLESSRDFKDFKDPEHLRCPSDLTYMDLIYLEHSKALQSTAKALPEHSRAMPEHSRALQSILKALQSTPKHTQIFKAYSKPVLFFNLKIEYILNLHIY